VGGIIGAIGALLFYAVLYPLMLGETPLRLLAGATNPLAMWSARLLPGAPWVMLIPILASTAGGLWLTTFILTRALYAMGRERLVPSVFARLNRRQVPYVAIVASLGLTLLVISIQVLVSSLSSFFNLVLSAAGFFLLAEFFLDSVTATVFLTVGHRRMPEVGLDPHAHHLLRVGAVFSTVVMGALLVAFFIYGPRAIGGGIDQTIAVLLVLGLAFAWWTKRRSTGTVVFAGRDVEPSSAVGPAVR
ncbi:MAG: APC family permease, partial [Candidatus Dormibacteria bacterium]